MTNELVDCSSYIALIPSSSEPQYALNQNQRQTREERSPSPGSTRTFSRQYHHADHKPQHNRARKAAVVDE
jgi:hypothetical protein